MNQSFRLLMLAWLLVLFPVAGYPNTLLIHTLESLRDAKTAAIGSVYLLSGRLLADFYVQRGNQLVWTEPSRLAALLKLIEESPTEGFSPADFHVDVVREATREGALAKLDKVERLSRDIQLSDALLRYVHHTRFGKLDPVAVDRKWNDRPPIPADILLADMHGALAARRLEDFLSSRISHPFWYQDLKNALGNLTAMDHLEGLPPLPSGPNLAKGSRGARVALLRERLQLIGHGDASLPSDLEVFDDGLVNAVKDFQRRMGLSQDGIVGPQTLATISAPMDVRKIEQVRINLERMRWLFDDLPPDYVFVDITDYMVHLVRNGDIFWSTRVIVGTEKDQTPMFRDSMNHLVFNPTWSIPVSIQKKMGNVSSKYTLVDRRTGRKSSGGNAADYKRYRVIQQPGPSNALGQVKFMFPNRHAIYLHDTPSRGLFGRSQRALSHGCVRVQNPLEFAELLLSESGWSRARVDQIIENSRTRYVNLERELPILLYYLTARADGKGAVYFRPDIYNRDEALRAAFSSDVRTTRIAFPDLSPIPTPEVAPVLDGIEHQQHQDDGSTLTDAEPSQSSVRLTQTEESGI